MIEERETFVVFAIAVDRVAMKIGWSIDQKCRRAVRFAVKSFRVVSAAGPVDLEIIDRDIPKILALCLQVARRDEERVDADILQRFRQRSGDVSEASGLGIRNSFG